DLHQAAELYRDGLVRAGRHHVQDVLELHVRIFGVLDRHEVLVAAFGIDPEIAIDGHAGVHGGGHLVHDIVFAQPHVGGLFAVDINDALRGIDALLDMDVGGAADVGGPLLHSLSPGQPLVQLAAFELNVDG